MNIFEMFGFFILGSLFNITLVILFAVILVNRIKAGLNSNIQELSEGISKALNQINELLSVFKKKEAQDGKSEKD